MESGKICSTSFGKLSYWIWWSLGLDSWCHALIYDKQDSYFPHLLFQTMHGNERMGLFCFLINASVIISEKQLRSYSKYLSLYTTDNEYIASQISNYLLKQFFLFTTGIKYFYVMNFKRPTKFIPIYTI